MRSFLGVPIVARDEVIGAFYLTEKEGARQLRRRRPGADRAAGRPRRDRDHQRPAVRAQPRAVDPVRAQPAGARAARRRQPEAVQPQPQPPTRPPRCWTATRQAARAQLERVRELAREALGRAALADPRAAPGRPRARRARGRAAQGGRDARAACTASRSSSRPTAADADEADGGERELEVLRIADEALHNAVRHAAAQRVDVRLRRRAADALTRRGHRRRDRLRSRAIPSCARGISA